MRKLLLFVFLFCVTFQTAFALEVVYPKRTPVTINAKSTFFIGSARTDLTLKINGVVVDVHPSGGFAHVVNLNPGKNTFVLEEGDKKLTYEIIKPLPKTSSSAYVPPKFVEYGSRKSYFISTDNVPLRETPIDAGVNRLSHLQADIPLTVDGEKSNFYRVVLNGSTTAWVSKTNVKAFEGFLNTPAVVYSKNYLENNEYYKFIFELDKKTPFVITENPLMLKFYNVKDCPDNTYTFTFPVNQRLVGYSGYYQGNKFILKVRKFPDINPKKPLEDIKITLDAGHGGNEWGAIGCCGDKEKDINLAITKYLEDELKSRGAKVNMTRDGDYNVGLRERVDIANQTEAMFLLSIHGNALPDGADPIKRKGTSVFYYYNQAKPLAGYILSEMTAQLGTSNDQIRQGSLALVRNTDALSVLIEVAYLINPEDNANLRDKKFQKKCAKAIADGIEKFLCDSKK